VFKAKKHEKEVKKLYNSLKKRLLKKIENWKQYKPIRGKIEDFSNYAKQD